MAITRAETQVKWGAANSLSVIAGGSASSDLVTLDATCVAASITLKATNAGAPASGDTVDFFARFSSGDPDGAATIEHASADNTHAEKLGRIDVGTSATRLIDVPFRAVPQNVIIYVENNGASSATVSATIEEQRAA